MPLASIPCQLAHAMGSQKNVDNSGHEEDEEIKKPCTSEGSDADPVVCGICLGILQFNCSDNNKLMVKKRDAEGLTMAIVEVVKQEGHEIDSFLLEVSVPADVQENERKVW